MTLLKIISTSILEGQPVTTARRETAPSNDNDSIVDYSVDDGMGKVDSVVVAAKGVVDSVVVNVLVDV